MAIICGPTEKKPSHHVKLSLAGTEVGLILCNSKGEAEPKAYMPNPLPGTALKIAMGETGYGDSEPPWFDAAQEDWSGGRHAGQMTFDEAQDQYADSLRMDATRPGRLVVGPMVRYATGVRSWAGCWLPVKQDSNDDYYWEQGYQYQSVLGTSLYMAGQCTTGGGFTTAHAWIMVRRTGTPGDLTVSVYSDSGSDTPNAALARKNATKRRRPNTSSSTGPTPARASMLRVMCGASPGMWRKA